VRWAPGFPAAALAAAATQRPSFRTPSSRYEVWDVPRNFAELSRGLEVITDPSEAESFSPGRTQLG
jgi:hypothetical protein